MMPVVLGFWLGDRTWKRPEETKLEATQQQQGEKEETELPSRTKRCTERQTQLESGKGQPVPAHHGDMQEATSENGPEQEKERRKEKKRKFAHVTFSQKRQHRSSDVFQVERCLRRPFPRGPPIYSYADRQRERQAEEPRGPRPFYFFGGANGAEIVSSYCESRGWKRIYDKHREDFILKWCETRSPTNYHNFRPGEKLVYQIPNNKVLTTKIGLLSSLRDYERVCSKVSHGGGPRRLKMEEFIPTTFRLDVKKEREAFFSQYEGVCNNESCTWICKPTGLNQGRGIFLLKTQEDVAALSLKLQDMEDRRDNRKTCHRHPQAHIVQRYIQRPLLLRGRKFDVRSYLFIACTAPYMVFFRHGYVRLTCDLYDPSSNNLSAHLTNQFVQKKNPLYSQLKEDTVWSMESFNAYVNHECAVSQGVPRDWVLGAFTRRMQRIMTQCFLAVKSKLDCRLGFFDLIGCDFMIDEEFQVWLLEMNCNPALHTNCEVLKEVIPTTVVETLDLTLEIFTKCRLGQGILPLASQRDFVLLYAGRFLPESVLPRSQSNKTTNSRLNHKPTKKLQKATRCLSEREDSSSAVNCENVLASCERGSGSMFASCPTTCTSPLQQSSERSKDQSVQPPDDIQTTSDQKLGPQRQQKLSKRSVRHQLKASSVAQLSEAPQKKSNVVSLSVPESENSSICHAQVLQSGTKTSQAVTSVCDARGRKEEPGEDKIREHTDGSASERKEEL